MTVRRDFLAFTAGAVVARTVLPAVTRAEPVNPDADLIAACEQHPALLAAYNADPDEWEGPKCAAMTRTCELIRDAKPQTMAGVVAKARAAKAEALGPSGEEQVDFTSEAGAWAWDVLNDLLRLTGGAA